MKLFKIMGEYRGKTEELDEAYKLRDAEELAREQRIILGEDWRVWVDEEEDEDADI